MPALGLQAPGLGARFFVPAHARPILTDGFAARRRPIGTRSLFPPPPPLNPGAPPLRLPTWSGPARLACSSGVVP